MNIALFVLTLASLYLAYQGVKLARITLEDAHTQAAQTAADSAQAAKNQRVQFDEQMKQLKTSSDALGNAGTLLGEQSVILRRLQRISEQQLNDLDAAEHRVREQTKSHPLLNITGSCIDQTGYEKIFLSASEKDFSRVPKRVYINSAILSVGVRDELACTVLIGNDGTAELKNAGLFAEVWCLKAVAEPVLITSINRMANIDGNIGFLVQNRTLPPRSNSGRMEGANFTLKYGTCTNFKIHLELVADNSQRVRTITEFKLE